MSKNAIYLDFQATTPVDPKVLGVMLPYFGEWFGNPNSRDHVVGWRADQVISKSKKTISELIGADPDEIIITSGATESNNMALFGISNRINKRKKNILVSSIEHKCVLEISRVVSKMNDLELLLVPVDKDGLVDLDFIKNNLNNDTLYISIMTVNNEIGSIQPIEEISKLSRKYDVFFHTDAAQLCENTCLDLFESTIDLLSLSSHKMYGPQGVGALYINREVRDKFEPIFQGGGQQDGFRPGTVPLALTAGFAAAAEELTSLQGQRSLDVANRRNELWEMLQGLDFDLKLNGPPLEHRHSGNLNVCFKGFSAPDILSAMQPDLAASTGSACTSGIPHASHVLRAIGLSEEDASASIRFSVGRFTTDEDICRATDIVERTLKKISRA